VFTSVKVNGLLAAVTAPAKVAFAVARRRCVLFAGATSLALMSVIAPGTAPALAAPGVVLGAGITTQGDYTYAGACKGAVAVGTNGLSGPITYVIDATGTGAAKNGARPIAATVICVIKDKVTGAVYGSITGALPLPTAVAAGTVQIPINANPEACVGGDVIFSDAGHANQDPNDPKNCTA
jgi:hypothetical protein